MRKSVKFILGSGIVTFLIILSLYLVNNQKNDEIIPEDKSIQNDVLKQSEIAIQEESITEQEVVQFSVEDNNTNTESASTMDNIEKNKAEIAENTEEEIISEINHAMNQYYDIKNKVTTDLLSQKVIEQRQELINQKKDLIEAYENVANYIKAGLTKDTFIVFTSYDIKLIGIETKVPGMSVLSLGIDEEGKYIVNKITDNEALNKYIKELAEEKDIKSVVEDINTRLNKAVKSDKSLKKFIDYLKEES